MKYSSNQPKALVKSENCVLDLLSTGQSLGWDCLASLVGRTPMLRLDLRCEGQDITAYAKAEMFNLSGSIKDRMALTILRRAIEAGQLMPGQRIVEATSGNAGIAIAAMSRALGHPVTIFMPDWMSMERQALLKSYGAELRLVSKEEGGFLGSIAMAETMGRDEGAFLPRQFSNEDNCLAHYRGTGPELWNQLQQEDVRLGGFVAGVGTGGTVMGVGRYLKEKDPRISVHPVEPAESPTLSTGTKVGAHRIQGVSDEFIPDIVKLDQIDEIFDVNDGDAILMAQKLCQNFALGVGISSGANLVAAIKLARQKQDGLPIATVFADGNTRYLSTDLVRAETVQPHYLTPSIDIERVSAVGVVALSD